MKKRFALCRHLLLSALLAPVALTSVAAELDCPLRDAAFSLDTPLVDVLLSPAASAAVDQFMPGLTSKLPPNMMGTKAPTFAAIMSVRTMASMAQIPTDKLELLNQSLAKVKVTDADRKARCERYDNDLPSFELTDAKTKVLVFTKINGFDHGPSVTAATETIQKIGKELGWDVAVTNKGGAFNAKTLAQFDAVVWNNNSGDVLTLTQRKAFEDYINNGGGFLGMHGAGGDFIYFWEWYADTLLGARFIGHPFDPQFQEARVKVESHPDHLGQQLMSGWSMTEEWYSFRNNPRSNGAHVIATLDESTYKPEGRGGQDLRMGEDHPIVWTRCLEKGRAMYTAIGHRPEVYSVPQNLTLLKEGLQWVTGQSSNSCSVKP